MGGESKSKELPNVPDIIPTLKLGSKGPGVIELKKKLVPLGYELTLTNDMFGKLTETAVKDFQKDHGLDVDGVVGPVTWAKLDEVKPEPVVVTAAPIWLEEAKKHTGKKESDSQFNAYLSGFWKIVGLPNYKTIVGTSFAWCGLFVAAMLFNVDLPFQKNGAGAKNWAKYGVEIDWKVNGIPRGAILQINHTGKCVSGSGNHVGFADGDCSAEDLLKPNAKINIFGGNQSNTAKVSTFGVFEICAVRWPPEVPVPLKVTKSVNCSGTGTQESTR